MKPGDPGEDPKPREMMRQHQAMVAMTTPERLDMMARRMDDHIAEMRERFQRHSVAIKGLYGAGSPKLSVGGGGASGGHTKRQARSRREDPQ